LEHVLNILFFYKKSSRLLGAINLGGVFAQNRSNIMPELKDNVCTKK